MQPAYQDRQVTLAGKSYTLRFSMKAIAALQDHFKLKSLDDVIALVSNPKEMNAERMCAILWACLRTHHPEITLEECPILADDAGVLDLMSALGATQQAAMAKKKNIPGPLQFLQFLRR